MLKKITGVVLALCAVVVMHANTAQAQEETTTTTTTTSSQLELLQSLMAQIEVLKAKLAELTGQAVEIRQQLRADIREGATGDDVKKIQELLASDPTLYPEGLKTGYFGPMTKEALKRFQLRHELEVTGLMDEDTRALLEEYLTDSGNAGIPPGFLRAPGIQQKIEMRFVEGCENRGKGKAAFCNKVKMKWKMDDDEEEFEYEEEDESEDEDDVIDNSEDATEAIEDAEAVIAALEAAIADSTASDSKIENAEDDLAEAEELLEEAQGGRSG